MVTRKSGDGSRSAAEVGSDRPGSYVKVSGSRRRRKRRGSTMPPPQESPSLDESRIVDTVGESDDGRGSDPGGDLVDDLRSAHARGERGSQPSSNRPRNQIGPLGIEDLRAEPPANSVGSDRPHTLNVVEINASESPRHDPFGDEITTQSPSANLFEQEDEEEEEDPVSALDRELAREYALDALKPAEPENDPENDHDRPSLLSVRDMLARREEYDTQEARHSLSSVLGARPSLRPSPQPERPRDSASVLWWLVVAALVAIIAAAGAIAAREQFAKQEEELAPVAPVQEPVAEPVVEASKPPAVSFGTPQTPEPAKPEPVAATPADPVAPSKAAQEANRPRTPASPAAPSVVPPSQSAAARAGGPNTSVATGAAATARPVEPGPAASAVKPIAAKAKPAPAQPRAEPAAPTPPPAAGYAPGYGKALDGTAYAPGYGPATEPSKPALRPGPDATRGKPNLAPANESRDNELPGLPINPYE
jgi:hypothetical protein